MLTSSILVWAIVYAVGIAIMYWPETGGFDRQLVYFSKGLAKVAETNRNVEAMNAATEGINLVLMEFSENSGYSDADSYNIWKKDGAWVAGSPNAPHNKASSSHIAGFQDVEIGGESHRVYAAWTSGNNYWIEVMQAKRGRRAEFNNVMLSPASVLIPLLVGFPLLLLPVLLVVRCGLKPLKKLSGELAARQPDDLHPIEVGELVPDLRPVVDEVNRTLARLRDLLKRERDFLADAAHEIRTPLAVISARAESVLAASDPAARTEAVLGLKTSLGRANRLVNQLLALARFDARADDVSGSVDAADIIRDSLAAYSREASSKSMQLTYSGPDHFLLTDGGHALASIVGNLVGNAVRHGQACGRVDVRLYGDVQAGIARLSVCDDGPGIPREDRAQIFDRFRRGSRSGVPGSGLGLAIVASAARLLDARIDISSGLGGQGICFDVVWNMKKH